MVVLQLTGMDSVAGLENNRECLRKAAKLNSKKHENDEWCLRAKEFSHQYEMTQTKKFFQNAIANGLISDPSKAQQIIPSTPANSKKRLQNVEKALQESSSENSAIRSEIRAFQWRFNAAIAVGLVICGILLFRKSIRWRSVYISGTGPYSISVPILPFCLNISTLS